MTDEGPVMVQRGPDARMTDYVLSYTGYYEEGAGYRQVTMPSGAIVFILNFGSAIRDVGIGAGEEHSSFVAGLTDRHGLIEAAGLSYGIQVNLTPVGAGLITGLPMHTLVNRVQEVDDVFGPAGPELVERLESAPDWDERFVIIDAFLERRLARAEPPAGILWTYHALRSGESRIGSLAEQAGYSHKHLIDQFREHVGLPPRTVARILRFQRALGLIPRDGRPDFGRVAQDAGYFDQAHFNREFKEFAGMTPRDYVRRRRPSHESIVEPLR